MNHADPVQSVKEKIEATRELWQLGCPAQARAALAVAEEAASALGEFERERVEDDLRSIKADVTTLSTQTRRVEEYRGQIEGYMRALERSIEHARELPDQEDAHYEGRVRKLRAMLGDDDNQALLGPELRAKFERKLTWIAEEIVKARVGASLARAEELQGKIQAVLDGQDTSAHTETVDKWFRWCAAALARCPVGDTNTDALRSRLDEQRRTLEKNLAEQYLSDVIEPALSYWTYVNETYGPEAHGWESETAVTSVRDFTNQAPPALGCPRTELLLREIVVRWLQDYRTAEVLEKVPNFPSFKATHDEATRLREEAGGKVCAFANTLLSEAEKLPAGGERDEFQAMLGVLEQLVTDVTQGSTACERTLTRIRAVDRRWRDEKEQGAADRAALEKKHTEAANAAWPELIAELAGSVKKLDPSDALARSEAWQGTVVHYTGGARGVNLNRAGWNYQDQYDFIVEQDGVPVCGNFDEGLAEGLRAFSAEAGVQPDDCEECIGVVEGTCRVWERVQHPLDRERYIRGRQLDAVRLRIVAWKACTVAACVNRGTSLSKVEGASDVSVSEMGRSR